MLALRNVLAILAVSLHLARGAIVQPALPAPTLPVWPVWGGVLAIGSRALGLEGVSRGVEASVGGVVRPIQLGTEAGDDVFLLLAHHKHSFWPLDPFRQATQLILPEGFPAHPHRGFTTLTYVIEGGMRHRDSLGVKQAYGPGCAQYLTAGRGVLHEEFWLTKEFQERKGDAVDGSGRRQELLQLWINLPARHKLCDPRVSVAGPGCDEALPVLALDGAAVRPLDHPAAEEQWQQGAERAGTVAKLVAGTLGGACAFAAAEDGAGAGEPAGAVRRGRQGEALEMQGGAGPLSPLYVLHVKFGADRGCRLPLPAGWRMRVYALRGDLRVNGEQDVALGSHAAVFSAGKAEDAVELQPLAAGAEAFVMAAQALGEPVAASGPFVMDSQEGLRRAMSDYYEGSFGPPQAWDHTADNAQWEETVEAWRRTRV